MCDMSMQPCPGDSAGAYLQALSSVSSNATSSHLRSPLQESADLARGSSIDFNDVDKAVRQYWRSRSAAASEAKHEQLPFTSYDIFKVRASLRHLHAMYHLQECAYRVVQSKQYFDPTVAQCDLDAALAQWESVVDEFGMTLDLVL
jgi:hypothetical protein